MSERIAGLVDISREEAVLLLESGYLYLDMGNHKAAQAVFQGAAALLPKSEVPQIALGTLEFSLGRPEKALQAFRAAQRLSPKASLPRAHCGEALLFLGKKAEAEKELKAAVELDRDGDGGRLAQALLDAVQAGALPPEKKAKGKK